MGLGDVRARGLFWIPESLWAFIYRLAYLCVSAWTPVRAWPRASHPAWHLSAPWNPGEEEDVGSGFGV